MKQNSEENPEWQNVPVDSEEREILKNDIIAIQEVDAEDEYEMEKPPRTSLANQNDNETELAP